jgi:DNA-binding NtrC family response regulator
VAELELDLQPRLLRVLETREVARLGSDKPRKVDVRLVAATNKDLTRMVKEGTFREDLYHRLSVVNVELPPLRERKEDIALLAARFVEEAARRFGRDVRGLSSEARALLTEQPWPGNVRQLKNAIESAVVLADGEMLTLDDFSTLGPKGEGETVDTPILSSLEQLAGPIDTSLPFMEAKRRLILEFERRYIAAKLSNCQGNISRAARELGMHRQSLQQKLKSLGIKEPVQ